MLDIQNQVQQLKENFKLSDSEVEGLTTIEFKLFDSDSNTAMPVFTQEQLDRVFYLEEFEKGLLALFAEKEQAYNWIHLPHTLPPFDDLTPLSFMIKGGLPAIKQSAFYILSQVYN